MTWEEKELDRIRIQTNWWIVGNLIVTPIILSVCLHFLYA